MSIQSEIDRISQNIAAAYTALEAKGATMPDIENSDNLAATIESIPTGGGSGVEIVKLWENASPESTFAAQTITIDLSAYSWFVVEYRFSTTTVGHRTHFAPIDGSKTRSLDIIAPNMGRIGNRGFVASAEGFTFDAATYNAATNNAYVIPTLIYGVKGVT